MTARGSPWFRRRKLYADRTADGWAAWLCAPSTCIEDLRQTRPPPGAARVLRLCRRAAPMPRRRCAPTAPISQRIKLRQRVLVDVSRAQHLRTTILGEPACAAARAGADRALRHAARRRRNPRLPRGAGGRAFRSRSRPCRSARSRTWPRRSTKPFWFQLYVMKDRGFVARADRARRGRQMQRAGAHRRSAGAGPAPSRHQERHDGAAGNARSATSSTSRPSRPGRSASLRGKRKTFGNLAGHVRGMENVNSLAQWIASQFDPALNWKDVEWISEPLAGQAHPQGHSRCRGRAHRGQDRRGGARGLQSRRPPARRRVVDLGAAEDRRCGRLRWKSCSTAASAPART